MRMLSLKFLFRVSGLFFCLQVSRADIIFSDLGPGGTYFQYGGTVVSGTDNPDGAYSIAAAFTPATDFFLTQIDVGITYFAGSDFAAVSLRDDADGRPGNSYGTAGQLSLPPLAARIPFSRLWILPRAPLS